MDILTVGMVVSYAVGMGFGIGLGWILFKPKEEAEKVEIVKELPKAN